MAKEFSVSSVYSACSAFSFLLVGKLIVIVRGIARMISCCRASVVEWRSVDRTRNAFTTISANES